MNYKTKLFLSYSKVDRDFARRLYNSLIGSNIEVWMDEREIRVGDEIRQKIDDGISSYDFFGIVVSNASINSRWIQYELSAAFMREMEEKRVVILPIKIDNTKLPPLISSKRYADFSADFSIGLNELLDVLHEIVVIKYDLGCSNVIWNARKGDLNGEKRIKTLHLQIKEHNKSIHTVFALIAGVGEKKSAIKASNLAANVLSTCIMEPLKIIGKIVLSPGLISSYFNLINKSLMLEKTIDRSPEFKEAGVKMVFSFVSEKEALIASVGDVCAIVSWDRDNKRMYSIKTGKSAISYSIDNAVALSAPLGFMYDLNEITNISKNLESSIKSILDNNKIEEGNFGVFPEIVPFTGKGAFIALLSNRLPYDDKFHEGFFKNLAQVPKEGIARFLCQKLAKNDHCMTSVFV